jgi:dodecin
LDHVYKRLDLVGTSTVGVEDAVNKALVRAGQTVRNMHWVEVDQIRGMIENGKVSYWQVAMKVGFKLDDDG